MGSSRSPRSAVLLLWLLAASLGAAACGGSDGGSGGLGTRAPTATAPPSGEVTDPAWATAELVDVTTGESFRIADFAGKVVIVETMAIWCTKCRAQQDSVEQALSRLPAERVAYVLLDVDPSENAESLAAYRAQRGYTGRYAIAPREVATALADDFSDQFLNPPSTPMAIIAADGTVTRTDFGQKSPDDIVALVTAAGA